MKFYGCESEQTWLNRLSSQASDALYTRMLLALDIPLAIQDYGIEIGYFSIWTALLVVARERHAASSRLARRKNSQFLFRNLEWRGV